MTENISLQISSMRITADEDHLIVLDDAACDDDDQDLTLSLVGGF